MHRENMKNKSLSDKVLIVTCYSFLILLGITIIIPVMNLIAVSLSTQSSVVSGQVYIFPKGFHIEAYKYIMQSKQFYSSLYVSLFVTGAGSILAVICSILVAYPLSKRKLPGRKWLLLLFVFTMMFSGGIIPSYLLIQNLNLINSVWSLILPQMINVYNLLIIKNYFEAMNESIEESAKIDGAGQLRVLFSIVLPMAKPVIATVFMFFVVGYWNNYFDAKMYITKRNLMLIQQYLQTVIFEAKDPTGDFALNASSTLQMAPQTIINATVVYAMVPMVILYPLLQKFFEKGTMIGSVKG